MGRTVAGEQGGGGEAQCSKGPTRDVPGLSPSVQKGGESGAAGEVRLQLTVSL